MRQYLTLAEPPPPPRGVERVELDETKLLLVWANHMTREKARYQLQLALAEGRVADLEGQVAELAGEVAEYRRRETLRAIPLPPPPPVPLALRWWGAAVLLADRAHAAWAGWWGWFEDEASAPTRAPAVADGRPLV